MAGTENHVAKISNEFVRQVFSFARCVSLIVNQDSAIPPVVTRRSTHGCQVIASPLMIGFRRPNLITAQFGNRSESKYFPQAASDFCAWCVFFCGLAFMPFDFVRLIVMGRGGRGGTNN